jgi:hypothetical protein
MRAAGLAAGDRPRADGVRGMAVGDGARSGSAIAAMGQSRVLARARQEPFGCPRGPVSRGGRPAEVDIGGRVLSR